MITIQELLNNRGLDSNDRIKLVRHKDNRRKDDGQEDDKLSLINLYRRNKAAFLKYQSAQKESRFGDVDYIVSFIGEDGGRARFVGVFRIIAELPMDDAHRTCNDDNYYYVMEDVDGFDDLKERVIVKWNNARAWFQWYKNEMEVIEVSPGLSYKPFTGYLEIQLSYDELLDIYRNKYPDWKDALSAVYGIYVIYDKEKGQLYIGSATNKDGVWGRWKDYANNGHGGDKSLEALLKNDKNYAYNFNFSLLAIMSKSSTRQEVLDRETLYKNKFGTKIHGLNNN